MGDAPDLGRLRQPPGKAIEDQARAALQYAGQVNLLFAHQDSDGRDPAGLRRHIRERFADIAGCPQHICVVPVHEIEAWLLVDQDSIRAVAGKPRGDHDLGLPPIGRIESTREPKEQLRSAIATASEKTGARLQALREQFPAHRAQLLQRLDIDGPINELAAWKQLVNDVNAVVAELMQPRSGQKRPTQ
jgi:hypothetical protein